MSPPYGASARICLLTPYTGSNLGDGAIQQGTIENIQARLPGVQISAITLAPADTLVRHGIPAFPMTGLLVRFYSESLRDRPLITLSGYSGDAGAGQVEVPRGGDAGGVAVLWRTIKAVPGLGSLARWALRLLRGMANVVHELGFLGRAYRFLGDKDMLIISGGGQLDDEWGGAFGHPYSLYCWTRLARLRGLDIAFLSVGVGKIRTRLSRLFVRRALRNADYISYRDTGSMDILRELSIDSGGSVAPDLAFSLHRPLPDPPKSPPARVVVSLISFGRRDCWPSEHETTYGNYLDCMVAFVRRLVADGFQVKIVCSSGADREAILDLRGELAEQGCELRDDAFPDLRSVDEFMSVLEGCDITVASRLHSVMLSHLAGRPCVAISFDRKVSVHMQDFDQTPYCLDILDVDKVKLQAAFEMLSSAHEEAAGTIDRHVDLCSQRLADQFEKVLCGATAERSAPAPAGCGERSSIGRG